MVRAAGARARAADKSGWQMRHSLAHRCCRLAILATACSALAARRRVATATYSFTLPQLREDLLIGAGSAITQRPRTLPSSGCLPRRERWAPSRSRRQRAARAVTASDKEIDVDAITKYVGSVTVQITAIAAFLVALDTVVASLPERIPEWAVFGLFFGMSLRSRIFSPLDNSRPDVGKATRGESTGGFNDRIMPSWTPPGFFFPVMWILIIAPLRAASSVMIWAQTGHLCDVTILALMVHLCIGDTWNTINNVERRLGAAVPGVLCVWASALVAAYSYFQVVPLAGQLLLPPCIWLTVASALVTDTWRVNNTGGSEPLYPYKGPVTTQFWFSK